MSVATILALSFAALVLVSVGSVLTLTVGANYRNTFDLIGKRATLLIDAMDDALQAQMSRAEDATTGIAEIYRNGGFEIDDDGAMDAALSGALSSVPAAAGMLIYDRDFNMRGVVRANPAENGGKTMRILGKHPEEDPDIRRRVSELPATGGLIWSDFVLAQQHLYAVVAMPLERGGETRGWIVAPIELIELSKIARDLSARFETTAFIIDGDDRILAHPHLLAPRVAEWQDEPTIPLAKFDDPVLAHFAERKPLREFKDLDADSIQISEVDAPGGTGVGVPFEGRPGYIVITKKIAGYGVRPWMIGAYFTKWEVGQEIMRTWDSALVGLALLICALILAILLGKRLSRPIKTIAAQAHLVANFDLDAVQPLPRSSVREFDDQASAFNGMLTGLRAFSAYVPRSLVARLVRTGDVDVTRPREATVTVMFSDIAGFTTLAETLPAGVGAELLNHHFAILCEAIGREGGTVDKFMGDGVMAFFGAPDKLKGHGWAAVRAAAAIRDAVAEDNRAARAEGRPPLRVRIGIHTGRVTVGNIGAADRVNYTIIGDTVNVSQRLQELGKLVAPDAETAIVISGETAGRLDERADLVDAGRHHLRGRGEAIEVFVVGDVSRKAEPAAQKLAQA